MAVAPAWMADKIIVLDDDEEDSPRPSCAAPASSPEHRAKRVSSLKAQQPAPTHITQSPFATAKKHTHVLKAENERLFTEFVEHCSALTQDCPEVLSFLQTKHAKASPDYLSSVEFRNALGRCLTRAQANRSKTFVFINELCTVLRQHAVKRRQSLVKVEPGPSTSTSSTLQSTSVESKDKTKGKKDDDEEEGEKPAAAEDEQPSTSGLQEDKEEEEQEEAKKAKRASRKQIAYLENLLKVYNDEISRLQQAELSLDDLGAEDSKYIQEHKLKRKMMKIYEKLCELKGCNILTGRVIEQRIPYKSTRYPEINRRIERYINSPEAQRNPPDYQDVLQQVLRANERHKLCLSRKQLNQMALDAFRETGSQMQERRHLDLVYNFGSQLTDHYRPATDPALSDPSLQRKLRSNREVALSRLEEVITKFSVKQEDTEEKERSRRLEKEGNKSEKGEGNKEVNGVAKGEEETVLEEEEQEEEEDDDDDDDEEDDSSDPDIEEEIQASAQQDGPDDNENEEDDSNEAEQAGDDADKEDQTNKTSGSVKDDDDEEEEQVTSGLSPLSDDSKSHISPPDVASPTDSPSQSEPMQTEAQRPLSNGKLAGPEEPLDSSNQVADASPVAANGPSSPPPSAATSEKSGTQHTIGTSPPPSPRATRSGKRKREEVTSEKSHNSKHIIIQDSEVNIPLDMGVFCCNSPQAVRAQTPPQDLVSSSQSTPPPKKNKVNVATQCDPDEIIVLSDSE